MTIRLSIGLLLVRGDLLNKKYTKSQANLLMRNTLKAYINSDLYFDHIKHFNHNPELFDYNTFKKLFKMDADH